METTNKSKYQRLLDGLERAKEVLKATDHAKSVHFELSGSVEDIPTLTYTITEAAGVVHMDKEVL